jgi:hypothetical protein
MTMMPTTCTETSEAESRLPVRVRGAALHIPAMSTLTHTHVRRTPTEHRITVMETPEDQHYYGRTYDNYPNEDGTVTRYIGDGYEKERVTFMGMHLIEELDSRGRPNGRFDLLTPDEFNEQFMERGVPGLEYGYRAVGGVNIFHHPNWDIATAREGVKELEQLHPLGKFEVISRPAGSDDDWTVVGR